MSRQRNMFESVSFLNDESINEGAAVWACIGIFSLIAFGAKLAIEPKIISKKNTEKLNNYMKKIENDENIKKFLETHTKWEQIDLDELQKVANLSNRDKAILENNKCSFYGCRNKNTSAIAVWSIFDHGTISFSYGINDSSIRSNNDLMTYIEYSLEDKFGYKAFQTGYYAGMADVDYNSIIKNAPEAYAKAVRISVPNDEFDKILQKIKDVTKKII